MRIVKKLTFIMIALLLCTVFIGKTTEPVEAATLINMTNDDGTAVKFRNSSVNAKQLKEFDYPINQLRAVWVSVAVSDIGGYSSVSSFKSQHNAMLDNLEKWGMNTLVYHVRTHNNALYKSSLNPTASWWGNVNFNSFDPLEWLITECHNRGIEFHAWMNPYRVSSGSNLEAYKSGTIPSANPMTNTSNLLYATDGNGIILDPGIPSNREFLVDTCMELVENYDIDAIHFDDYFYIDNIDDSATRTKYNTSGMTIGNFRREQVNLFIKALSTELRAYNKSNNRAVQLGIAPTSAYKNGGYYSSNPSYNSNGDLTAPLYSNTAGAAHYDDYWYADTLKWINNEWIDYIMPQMYHGVTDSHSPFIEFTKWWSMAVAKKKVNFYAGIGIYMADTSEDSWNKNDNEFQKQLLNAAQYTQYKGACLYKYSTLVSSTKTAVTNAVNLISNDYWDKRVPGAVIQAYADSFGETPAKNCRYSTSSSSVVYDKVEGVRGYVVWRAKKGTSVNMSDINCLVSYTGGTSVKVDDVATYDYFVSTVNQANEISTPVKVDFSATTESVKLLIDQLPSVITYENKAQVDAITNIYNQLSNDDKRALGSALTTYRNAVATIEKYETLISKLDSFISTLDTHIAVDRKLAVGDGMSWSYATQTDANIYNISTGVRIKDYLTQKLITLNLTATDGTVSYTKSVTVNVGRLATSQTGMFYRNDPSCMSEYDDGSYSSTDSGYLGWSGRTLTLGTKVLFIAKGNYVDITDSSNIQKANYDNVGSIYVNRTGSQLTIASTSMYDTFTNNYGYFIISSSGLVKSVNSTFNSSTSIVLEANEAVMVPRYLDSTVRPTGTYCPATTLTVGTSAIITALIESEAELAISKTSAKQELDSYLASLELTGGLLNHVTEKINAYKQSVDNSMSSSSISAIVSSAKSELYEYVLDIQNAQIITINNINTFVNGLSYSSGELIVIKNNATSLISTINNTFVIEDITTLYTNFVTSTQNAHTEYLNAVSQAIPQLEALIKTGINEKQKNVFATLVSEAKAHLNTLGTASDVNSYCTSKLSEISSQVGELTNSINTTIDTLESYLTEETTTLVNKYLPLVNVCGSKEEVETVFNNFKLEYDALFGTPDYETYRAQAKAEITNFYNSLTYKPTELNAISAEMSNVFILIDSSTDIEYLESVAAEFKQQVESDHETLELQIVASAITVNSKKCDTSEARTLVQDTLNKLNNAGTLIEVVSIMNTFEKDFASANKKGCMNFGALYINLLSTLVLCSAVALFRKRK